MLKAAIIDVSRVKMATIGGMGRAPSAYWEARDVEGKLLQKPGS